MDATVHRPTKDLLLYWLFLLGTVVGLYLTTRVSYLLFHSIVELFSVIIACTVFIITWKSVQYIRNPYLVTVGISYLFIGFLDLLHTLGYSGMGVFTDYDYYANQLWIASRYVESVTMLVAFVLLPTGKRVPAGKLFALYFMVTALLIASIFYWKTFPLCFIPGVGQTPFKIYSEYAICAILAAGGFFLFRSRSFFTARIYRLILTSIVLAIATELCFTIYVHNYGVANLIGHYFKLFSFLMIYHAIVETGIEQPYELIFNELNRANESLRNEIELRKQLELASERASQSLRESEERFRSLFENAPDAVFLTVPAGRIVAANPAACAMFGRSEQDICRIGRDGLICQDDPRQAAALEERERTGRFVKLELCFVRKNGERFPGETDSVVLPGNYPQAFVIVRDITERKRNEAALKELNQELEKRVAERTAELHEKDQLLMIQSRQAAMGEMINQIAHQWRQPLNSLALLVQEVLMMQELGAMDRAYLEGYVKKALDLIQHMSRTVDDFRNFFKPDKEKVSFKVNQTTEKTLSLVQGTFREQGIEVEIERQGDPAVVGYPNELSQVLLNIVINARDALLERKVPAPKIRVAMGEEEDKAVVTITDNAGGIDEAIIARIFDPYFTTKGPQAGTGVGLSMSKTIIEKSMGGRLTVRNAEGGAQFRIELSRHQG